MSEQKNQQKQPPKRATSGIFAILMALLLLILGQQGILPLGDTADAPDALPTATIAAALTDSPTSAPTQAPQQTAITSPQDIADYIFAHGTLPGQLPDEERGAAAGLGQQPELRQRRRTGVFHRR